MGPLAKMARHTKGAMTLGQLHALGTLCTPELRTLHTQHKSKMHMVLHLTEFGEGGGAMRPACSLLHLHSSASSNNHLNLPQASRATNHQPRLPLCVYNFATQGPFFHVFCPFDGA